MLLSVCRKTLFGSKDGVLWRVRGYAVPSQNSPSPFGGGVGVGAGFGVLTPEKDFFDKLKGAHLCSFLHGSYCQIRSDMV